MCVSVLFCQESEEQTKCMEDLEFQKLERETNEGEEKENKSQELLEEIAEYQRLSVTRKVQRARFFGSTCLRHRLSNLLPGHSSTVPVKFQSAVSVFRCSGSAKVNL